MIITVSFKNILGKKDGLLLMVRNWRINKNTCQKYIGNSFMQVYLICGTHSQSEIMTVQSKYVPIVVKNIQSRCKKPYMSRDIED